MGDPGGVHRKPAGRASLDLFNGLPDGLTEPGVPEHHELLSHGFPTELALKDSQLLLRALGVAGLETAKPSADTRQEAVADPLGQLVTLLLLDGAQGALPESRRPQHRNDRGIPPPDPRRPNQRNGYLGGKHEQNDKRAETRDVPQQSRGEIVSGGEEDQEEHLSEHQPSRGHRHT